MEMSKGGLGQSSFLSHSGLGGAKGGLRTTNNKLNLLIESVGDDAEGHQTNLVLTPSSKNNDDAETPNMGEAE
jgi:hypothetical protein